MKSPFLPWLPLLLVATACSYTPPGPVGGTPAGGVPATGAPAPGPPERVEASPTTPVLSDATMQRVLFLFDEADAALADRRLTSPPGESAWDHYREILALVPGNAEARQGLVNIIERYIQWSDAARRQGRLQQARLYLERAARVDPQYPKLVERLQRLDRQPPAGEHYIALDLEQLQAGSEALQRQLEAAAREIRQRNARVVIEAPTDRQGRWIYQQLNSEYETYRIRANFRLEKKPGLRLIY